MTRWLGDELPTPERDYREVEQPERRVRRLYASDGTVLASVSDQPPVGFHQGERGRARDP